MIDARAALKELSEPWHAGDRTKAMIDRAAKRAGIGYWRAFNIWYGKAIPASAVEIEQIQEALKRKRKVVAHNEIAELRTRMARIEALLLRTDEGFFSEDIIALRESGGRTS